MDLETIRAAKNTRPFVPFRLCFADGTSVDVSEESAMGFSRSYERGLVVLPDESLKRFKIADIVGLERLQTAAV